MPEGHTARAFANRLASGGILRDGSPETTRQCDQEDRIHDAAFAAKTLGNFSESLRNFHVICRVISVQRAKNSGTMVALSAAVL
jgi:hypothetical protein